MIVTSEMEIETTEAKWIEEEIRKTEEMEAEDGMKREDLKIDEIEIDVIKIDHEIDKKEYMVKIVVTRIDV